MINSLDDQMAGLNIPSEEITPVDNYDTMPVTGEEGEDVLIGASGGAEDTLDDRPSDHPGVRTAAMLKGNPLQSKIIEGTPASEEEEEDTDLTISAEDFKKYKNRKEEPLEQRLWGETKQLLGETSGVFGGTYRGTEGIARVLPHAIASIDNAGEFMLDWAKYGVEWAWDKTDSWLNDYTFLPPEAPEPWELRTNPASDLIGIMWNTHYRELSGEQFIKDFEANFRVTDRDRGWVDKMVYWSSSFVGELFPLPIGGKAIATAYKALPKKRIVDDLYNEILKGKKLSDIDDAVLQAAVRKRIMTDGTRHPAKIVRVREQAYNLLRGLGYHTKDALSYGVGAGLATTTAYGTLKIIDDEETADALAPMFGIFGMFMGHRPFLWGPKRLFVSPISRMPVGRVRTAEGGRDIITIGDIARTPFKIRHLIKAHRFKREENAAQANFHMLMYAGASKKEAKALSGESDATATYLNQKVSRQVIEDAVTFQQILQNLATKHPEYHKYITDARNRTQVVADRFKDIFSKDPVQNAKVKDVFVRELEQMNRASGRNAPYTPEELKDVAESFEVHDLEMMLDQIFMVDFLSGIRNMALNEKMMKTLTTKEAIDMFTEGFAYNRALQGQVMIIKAALKSLQSTDNISKSSTEFLNHIRKSYEKYDDDAAMANTAIQDKIRKAVMESKSLNERNYFASIARMGRTSSSPDYRFKGQGANAEEEYFDGIHDMVLNSRTEATKKFSKEYEGAYHDVDIPPNATSEQVEKLLEGAPLVEMNASNLMGRLDDTNVQEAIPEPLGTLGKSTTERVLGSKLERFKIGLRRAGLIRKFSTKDLADKNIDDIEGLAVTLDDDIKDLHSRLHSVDAEMFTGTDKITNLADPANKSRIDEVLLNRGEYDAAGFKDALISAIQKQVDEVAELQASKSTQPEQFNKTLNDFANPQMTIRDAHSIAKSLFAAARKTTDPRQKFDLNNLGHSFMGAIEEGAATAVGPERALSRLREISGRYKEEVADVYKLGVGQSLVQLEAKRYGKADPRTPMGVFRDFLTMEDARLAKNQFNKMFPLGKNRTDAQSALRYTLAKFIESGEGSLSSLSKGDFNKFKNNFKEIIGEKHMEVMEKYYKHQKDRRRKIREEEIMLAEEQFNKAMFGDRGISERTKKLLSQTVEGDLANKSYLNYEDIQKLLFSKASGTRYVREQSDRGVQLEKRATDAAGKLGIKKSEVEELLGKAQAPLRKEGPWGKETINDEVVTILLKDHPEMREPLQNMILQHIIDQSFTASPYKVLNPKKMVDLAEELNITEFSNIFNRNIDVLEKVFDKESLEAVQVLFEGGVITSGINRTVRLINLATQPTTQSRASRLFALQRKVVGMPYLATEQTVMAYQREKAAFLKRIVLNKDFALLMKTMVVDGNMSHNNIQRYINYLRAEYGENSIQKEDIPMLKRELQHEYEAYNNPANQQGPVDTGLTRDQIQGREYEVADAMRKEGLQAYLPQVVNPFFMSIFLRGVGDDLPESSKKAIKEAAKETKFQDERRFKWEQRQKMMENLLGHAGSS